VIERRNTQGQPHKGLAILLFSVDEIAVRKDSNDGELNQTKTANNKNENANKTTN